MQIAELFVKLGVVGADKSAKQVQQVDNSMQKVVSSSLAAKVAIFGALYALDRMAASSAMRGMELAQFAGQTGLSTDKLQQWQEAARHFGVSSQEVAGSISAVQQKMIDMLSGKGAPEGYGLFAEATKIDPTRLRDTYYVMDKLMEYARKLPPDLRQSQLATMGLSNAMIGFMGANKRDVYAMKPLNYMSRGQIDMLRDAGVQIEGLKSKWSIGISTLILKDGGKLIKDLAAISDQLLKMAMAFEELAKKTTFFERLSEMLQGFNNLLGVVNDIITMLSGGEVDKKKSLLFGGGDKKAQQVDSNSILARIASGSIFDQFKTKEPSKGGSVFEGGNVIKPKNPSMPMVVAPGQNTINQTVNVHTQTSNPKDHGNIMTKEAQKALSKIQSSRGQ